MPLPFAAFFVFLGLKLAHVIDWSWWLVTAPLWIAAILYVVFTLVVGTFIKSVWRRVS